MTYQLKEKAWTFRDTYEIKDAEGEVAYRIKAKVFSMSNKFVFEDKAGRDLLLIKKRSLGFKPKYRIKRAGKTIATIEKKWSMWRSKFKVDIPGPNDYIIQGEFWKREFEFERKGKKVAEVSKKFWSWSDTYGVQIEPGEDQELILATVIAINLFLKDKNAAEAEAAAD